MWFINVVLLLSCYEMPSVSCEAKPRLLILTDIGGDPDDQQSLIRLMLYANEFRLVGFVATSSGVPGELETPVTRPDLIQSVIEAYRQDLPRLKVHAADWPEPADLLSRVRSGNPMRGLSHVGEGHDTNGSQLIIECVDDAKPDDRVNIAIWGGQTDLAQALWRVRADRGAKGLKQFINRFRVYDINDQDGLADYLRTEFPGMYYILSKAPAGRDKRLGTYRGMYLTGEEALTSRQWAEEHLLPAGALGKLYPLKTWTAPNPHGCIKEGDTPSWFFFLPRGGNRVDDPSHPGWGGQYIRQADGWYRDMPATDSFDPRTTVSRWRHEFQNDFARRLRWIQAVDDTPPN